MNFIKRRNIYGQNINWKNKSFYKNVFERRTSHIQKSSCKIFGKRICPVCISKDLKQFIDNRDGKF